MQWLHWGLGPRVANIARSISLSMFFQRGPPKGFWTKLLPCSNPHSHKIIFREKLRICNQLLFLWWGLVVNVHTLFKVCSAALSAVLPFSDVTLLAPHWGYNFLFENKAKNWCPLGALIVWDAKVGANYAEYGMLISAQLNAFSFSAFSLLAPFFLFAHLSALGAWFRGCGRSENVFSRLENS